MNRAWKAVRKGALHRLHQGREASPRSLLLPYCLPCTQGPPGVSSVPASALASALPVPPLSQDGGTLGPESGTGPFLRASTLFLPHKASAAHQPSLPPAPGKQPVVPASPCQSQEVAAASGACALLTKWPGSRCVSDLSSSFFPSPSISVSCKRDQG